MAQPSCARACADFVGLGRMVLSYPGSAGRRAGGRPLRRKSILPHVQRLHHRPAHRPRLRLLPARSVLRGEPEAIRIRDVRTATNRDASVLKRRRSWSESGRRAGSRRAGCRGAALASKCATICFHCFEKPSTRLIAIRLAASSVLSCFCSSPLPRGCLVPPAAGAWKPGCPRSTATAVKCPPGNWPHCPECRRRPGHAWPRP